MGSHNESQSCLQLVSKLIMIVVNLGLVLTGVFLIYFSVEVNNSGWLDVFEGENAWLKSATFWLIVAFGVVVILVASIGLLGACMKNRCLLTTYAVCIVISMVLFIVVAIGSFSAMNTANSWKEKEFPAAESESRTAVTFDEVYCLSQGLNICLSGNITSTIKSLDQDIIKLVSSQIMKIGNISDLCSVTKKTMSEIYTKISPLCKACEDAKKYEKYHSITEWALKKCPAEDETLFFCANFFKNGAKFSEVEKDRFGASMKGTPYGQCRIIFLDLWEQWSSLLGIITLVFGISCLFIFVFACILRKKRRSRSQYYD